MGFSKEMVEKAEKVIDALRIDPHRGIENVCEDVGISKSQFYRYRDQKDADMNSENKKEGKNKNTKSTKNSEKGDKGYDRDSFFQLVEEARAADDLGAENAIKRVAKQLEIPKDKIPSVSTYYSYRSRSGVNVPELKRGRKPANPEKETRVRSRKPVESKVVKATKSNKALTTVERKVIMNNPTRPSTQALEPVVAKNIPAVDCKPIVMEENKPNDQMIMLIGSPDTLLEFAKNLNLRKR